MEKDEPEKSGSHFGLAIFYCGKWYISKKWLTKKATTKPAFYIENTHSNANCDREACTDFTQWVVCVYVCKKESL